ncbi:hypothetical protein FJZ17_00460 [Candidatus Pacearchaeota archaeon]|nr:hypothetical protein [Candidatus Pacearchaeota archaeon]
MGAKKRVQKIAEYVILVCPHCKKGTKAHVDIENCPQSYTCPKCKQEVRKPVSECCVICAYSKNGKPCPRTLYMKAKVKNLEIRNI